MRIFTVDGKQWVAQIHDSNHPTNGFSARAGWEVVQFDTEPPGSIQRITYRAPGWLASASIEELIKAMHEGENVRANWRVI